MDKGIKIAISGKGGVGKTTIASLLIRSFANNYNVLAVDADPNSTLAYALGFPEPEKITPVVEMKDLIEERMGTKLDNVGAYFKLNPKVDDIPQKYSAEFNNIKLIVMGYIKRGGKGCACPENTFVKTLISHLILNRNEIVIMDMEAGLEHLGRGTAGSVNNLLVVVEPSIVSIKTAKSIYKLANDLKIKGVHTIANKIRKDSDKKIIEDNIKESEIIGFIPYDGSITDSSISGKTINISPNIEQEISKIKEKIINR